MQRRSVVEELGTLANRTMTETPKIVHERLRAGIVGKSAAGSHPDANALNAFAEQALSLTEREDVLAHLASCATCRNVLRTALPEVVVPEPVVVAESQDIPLPVAKIRQRKALLWPSLRWGVLAAGVVTAVLLARPGFEHLTNPARNQANSGVQRPADAGVGSQTTVEKSDFRSSGTEAKSKTPDELTKAQASTSRSSQQRTAAASGNYSISGREEVSEPSSLIADNRGSSADHPFPMGSNQTAIVRAKPALGTQDQSQETLPPNKSQTQAGGALASLAVLKQSPQWVIEAGSLKRSLDGGLSWQTILQPANSLLCYASRGGQMWVGGQGGTLLRSTDGGAHWSAIAVSPQGKTLSSDIKNINLQDPASIMLTTTGDDRLVSKDGGTTWEQR